MTGFGLANPKLHGEREQARQVLEHQPTNRPAPGKEQRPYSGAPVATEDET